MDVFSLLKFWRTAGAGDLTAAGDSDSSFDDEDSFFDLVFTNPAVENNYSYAGSPYFNGGDSPSSFTFSSPDLNNKRNIFTFDSPNSKTPQSELRFVMLGFQNNQKSELETVSEIEEVKIGALLKRDNSLRCKLMTEKLLETDQTPSKRFSKDLVNKYLNRMKPSYARVSKRNSEKSVSKSRLSEKSVTPSSSPASSVFSPRKDEKRDGGRGGGAVLREVRKRLGKSRSANAILQTPANKNDDSAVEQQDGIQGAILHCKRSYNLSRSGSAPSKNQLSRISIEEDEMKMNNV